MPHPLAEVFVPESLQFNWTDHPDELILGPFTFPAEVPVPVAGPAGKLARGGWLNVPFTGRAPITGDIEGDGSDAPGDELLRAFIEGHLAPGSPDHLHLVDEVGRCLLIHATLGEGELWCEQTREVFARADHGAQFFEVLVHRAQGRVGEGVHFLEQKEGAQALYEYLLARLLYYGAHLLSPTTPGVLYEMGVITHDLAHQLQVENGRPNEQWRLPLAREAVFFLRLAVEDEEIRDNSPALFLLAANQDALEETDAALDSYERFLAASAAEQFPAVTDAARSRTRELRGRSGGGS